jgi:Sulfate permease family
MAKYSIANGTAAAVEFASELSLAMGLILCVMGILNLGSFIRFLSHPVISGFTSAAAMLIGLSQLKSAFNFSGVPQVGDATLGVEYQYEQMQWYIKNWNGQYNVKYQGKSVAINQVNHYAVKVSAQIIIINSSMNFLTLSSFDCSFGRSFALGSMFHWLSSVL